MGFLEAVVIIVGISVFSNMMVKVRKMKMAERSKLGLQSAEIVALSRKIELLESKMQKLEDENYELQKTTDKLEEHYDFINKLLESPK